MVELLLLLPVVAMVAYQRGHRGGWNDGIKVAREWETVSRDWRMMYEMEAAGTPEEAAAAYEVRQLRRMYDGV